MAIFDTDVLIDHLRGNAGAKNTITKFKSEKNHCSVITSGEILFGMRIKETKQTLALLDSFEELSVDKEIIRIASDVKLKAKGHKLELYDCVIAATAIKYDQLLVTKNKKHYPDKRLKLFIPEY